MKTKTDNKKLSTFNFQLSTRQNDGFTLIETVIAILILSLSIGALLTLSAGGYFSIRYARNQIIAYNLAQESLEYIRNTRDSAILQTLPWTSWRDTLNVDSNGTQSSGTSSGCFHANGCFIDPYTTSAFKIKGCSSNCQTVYFYPVNAGGFYGYQGASYSGVVGITPVATTYVKKIRAVLDGSGEQVTITVTVSWSNGSSSKTISQSTILTKWSQ